MTYLSGPMTGIKDHNYPAFRAAAKALRERGYCILSPHEDTPYQEGQPYAYYIQRDLITLLTRCDSIALLPGWEASRGAQLEYAVAETCGYLMYDVIGEEMVAR